MKYSTLIITLILLVAIESTFIIFNQIAHKAKPLSQPVLDTIIIHDTVQNFQYPIKEMDSMIKPYLMQYYKAGWIDACNNLIDFYNNNQFTESRIYKSRDQYWTKMQKQVDSK